jgi:hypothetical protein
MVARLADAALANEVLSLVRLEGALDRVQFGGNSTTIWVQPNVTAQTVEGVPQRGQDGGGELLGQPARDGPGWNAGRSGCERGRQLRPLSAAGCGCGWTAGEVEIERPGCSPVSSICLKVTAFQFGIGLVRMHSRRCRS